MGGRRGGQDSGEREWDSLIVIIEDIVFQSEKLEKFRERKFI